MSRQPETPATDERAILDQVHAIQAVYARGEQDKANALHADMVTRYGLTAIADAMARRDELQQLGTEVEFPVKSTC